MPQDDTQGTDTRIGPDDELTAIRTILGTLGSLNDDARLRVLTYIYSRLGMTAVVPLEPSPVLRRPIDIRSLTAEKKPHTSIEMAALVAYYLSELAPDRKKEIDSEDIQRYFEQADFPMVERPSKTLFDARNAGYLDAGKSRGNFKLNSVGHDFVAHLPGSRVDAPVDRSGRAAKPATVSKNAKRAARRIQPSRIKKNDV